MYIYIYIIWRNAYTHKGVYIYKQIDIVIFSLHKEYIFLRFHKQLHADGSSFPSIITVHSKIRCISNSGYIPTFRNVHSFSHWTMIMRERVRADFNTSNKNHTRHPVVAPEVWCFGLKFWGVPNDIFSVSVFWMMMGEGVLIGWFC